MLFHSYNFHINSTQPLVGCAKSSCTLNAIILQISAFFKDKISYENQYFSHYKQPGMELRTRRHRDRRCVA